MQETFTPNDLLLYAYGEAGKHLCQAIEEQLQWDSDLRRQLQEVKAIQNGLVKDGFSASQKSIDWVKSFNRCYEVVKTPQSTVELFLN